MQEVAAARDVVGLVGMDLPWPIPALAARRPDRRNGIDKGFEAHAVMAIGPVRRQASGIPCRSTIRCRFVPGLARSMGFGPVGSPPFFAGMLARSTHARSQSTCLEAPRSSSSAQCRRSQTPPVSEPSPAGHPGAAPHLDGQVFPRDADLEHLEDAGQAGAAGNPRTAALGFGGHDGQERFNPGL